LHVNRPKLMVLRINGLRVSSGLYRIRALFLDDPIVSYSMLQAYLGSVFQGSIKATTT
jgi:hypothetical protein